MTEETWGQQGTAVFAGQSAANDAVTAGALLRRAREASGLHVAALAVSLKVPVRKLEALEEDRWDVLPDAVFARALACSICRTLKIDPQPVLDRLPRTGAPRLIQDDEGINTPFRAPSDGAAPNWIGQLTRPVFLAVFALLLGALVLIFLPSVRQEAEAVATASLSAPAGAPAPAAAAMTRVETVVADPTPSPSGGVQDSASSPSGVGQGWGRTAMATGGAIPTFPEGAKENPSAADSAPIRLAAFPPAASPAPADAAVAAAAAAPVDGTESSEITGVIVFKATQPSWIEVTDAKGLVSVRRLLAAGETAGASGALPLQVIVGRADATEVRVRGKPFDLRRVSRENVARFEVK
jgi:cytoskeleton protein RodZ